MEIAFSPSFKKAFKKLIRKNKSLEQKFWSEAELFIEDAHHPSLQTHKLTGKLKNLWSFSVEEDCRVIFYFESSSKAVFIDIGSHDEVY
jgi:addiction module RelE/StbE family toxin